MRIGSTAAADSMRAELTETDRKLAELRGPRFIPNEDFENIRMVPVPANKPNRGDMLIGYVFDGRPEQFVEGLVSDRMPVAGPIFYEISIDSTHKHGARCAGCDDSSKYYADRRGDPEIMRWARKHRCIKRLELNHTLR